MEWHVKASRQQINKKQAEKKYDFGLWGTVAHMPLCFLLKFAVCPWKGWFYTLPLLSFELCDECVEKVLFSAK